MMTPIPRSSAAPTEAVSVNVEADGGAPVLAPEFLGLSYEMSMLLPGNGRYYFDPGDAALVHAFQTLGIKSLRVGANAVDDPRIPVPQEKDIDQLFKFARAAGVKVIYSFRLKNGNPAESARLAAFIAAHDADALECFAIGNEPNFYLPTFDVFFAEWKPHYDAILKAVPGAKFGGPGGSAGKNYYALDLAKALFAEGHLAMVSDHYYFLGSGRAAEKDPEASRARFLSRRLHEDYERDYAAVGAVLARQGVPYRIDEMNSCYNGGAKDSSDTYASTLWALDCTHWWAAHHILGVNYHTGESVGRDGGFGAANYAAFVHTADGKGLILRPQSYGLLAFSQAARGRPMKVKTLSARNLNAYAYQGSDGSVCVTLINEDYGSQAQPAAVDLRLAGLETGIWERMDLTQKDHDVAAKTGVSLGGAGIDSQGVWAGKWENLPDRSSRLAVQVPPASAVVLRFIPSR